MTSVSLGNNEIEILIDTVTCELHKQGPSCNTGRWSFNLVKLHLEFYTHTVHLYQISGFKVLQNCLIL